MAEKKQKKTEPAPEKKMITPAKPRKRPTSMIEPAKPQNVWTDFDRTFDRFRREVENFLLPREQAFAREFPNLTNMVTNIPSIDVEDKGDKFVMTAEVPGFKKDEVEISICGDTVEISGTKETKQDEKTKDYVRRERQTESFYRSMTLPEEIMFEEVSADLNDGVLEIVLPKKNPKQKKKVHLK